MPINKLEYADILMTKLDQQAQQLATSGWMEANAGQVKYQGGAEVKIPTMSTQGLADYDRDKGFTQGSISLTWNTYKMTQDRGRTFSIDAMDVDETAFIANATNVLGVFQREHVVPEIDSYRYSKIATIAVGKGVTENIALTADNALSKLRENIRAVQDVTGVETPLIITMPSNVLALIEDSPKVGKAINPASFTQGTLKFTVKSIDDNPIRIAPTSRLKSAYEIVDINTDPQGGLKPAAGAKDINWIITPQNIPLAISKTDKIRIFEPNVNQRADAWKIDYRKYHDLWILENKKNQIFVSFKA